MEEVTHKLTLTQRQKLTLTGVTEVIRFDENTVILATQLGEMTIQGQELHLKALSLEGGQLEVDGTISALSYEEPRVPGTWLTRLFTG